ncbi:hypothetical protein DL98DRAFT_541416 [Cadophora sp. DSE1049]|nr:hypothetical protein DL98DRAFT_541416 [Cadophora sp. DSE1049]
MEQTAVTPRKQQRHWKRSLSIGSSWTDDDSPRKIPITPQTPSKAALRKAQAAQRRGWKEDWGAWVARSKWIKDATYRQKLGLFEIYRSDAMKFYNLKGPEMDTLPHWEFENANCSSRPKLPSADNIAKIVEEDFLVHKYCLSFRAYVNCYLDPAHPGRSYAHDGVRMNAGFSKARNTCRIAQARHQGTGITEAWRSTLR